MAEPLVIAVLGAECTGKTSLCRELAAHLSRSTAWRCTWVPEVLRAWCDAQGRTPRQHEQAGIAAAQSAAIAEAARHHDLVVADTTALMTAVYSHIVFGDDSLEAEAAAAHRRCQLTLLTAIDLPWQADGLQRDGAQVQQPVDAHVRAVLRRNGIDFAEVSGVGQARVQAALSLVQRHRCFKPA